MKDSLQRLWRACLDRLPGGRARSTSADPVTAGRLGLAMAEIDRRNFAAALRLLDTAADARLTRRIMSARFRCLVALRMHDDIVGAFAKADARLQSEPSLRIAYIDALANLQRFEEGRAEIAKALLAPSDRDIRFLTQSIRYPSIVDERLKRMIVARVLSHSAHPRRAHAQLVRCCHELLALGQFSECDSLIGAIAIPEPDAVERQRLLLLNAQAAWTLGDVRGHIDAFNAAIAIDGVTPVQLINPQSGVSPHNVRAAGASAEGPLVSVLMTTFNSETTVGYAVESILGQCYRNIELIVVDDMSADRTVPILKQLGARDARLKIMIQTCNMGTYVAKNRGLQIAAGELVTCQDSDDWAHCDKIGTSVSRLMADASAISTTVRHIRCSADKGLQCRRDYAGADYSSLMYRREPVLVRLGFYDNVRGGADSEFQWRLERVFGRAAHKPGSEILSLVRASDDSLSRTGVFEVRDDPSVMSPLRNRYRAAFLRWHESAADLRIDFRDFVRADEDIGCIQSGGTTARV